MNAHRARWLRKYDQIAATWRDKLRNKEFMLSSWERLSACEDGELRDFALIGYYSLMASIIESVETEGEDGRA